jgi:hypothetical protein
MRKVVSSIILVACILSSSAVMPLPFFEYKLSGFRPEMLPDRNPLDMLPGIYDLAVIGTSVPAEILRAVAMAESDERDWAIGDGGKSLGRMQINEDFRDMRVAAYGYYNPHCPFDSTRIAARILEKHYQSFGNWRLAISAYNQGAGGTRLRGERTVYLDRVESKLGGSILP